MVLFLSCNNTKGVVGNYKYLGYSSISTFQLNLYKILQDKSLPSLIHIIQLYPEAEETKALKPLRNQLAFDAVTSTNTDSAYTYFIHNFPDAEQIEEIRYLKKSFSWYTNEYLLGRFDPKTHEGFALIDMKFCPTKDSLYMRREAYHAFLRMYEAAKLEGLELTILSSMRTYDIQKEIWEKKWTQGFTEQEKSDFISLQHKKEKPNPKNNANQKPNSNTVKDSSAFFKAEIILQYTSMPGTSRHHWGSDIDIYSVEPEFFDYKEGSDIYNWLKMNASKYGFFQPYTPYNDKRKKGIREEKWHWSYKPISEVCLKKYLENIHYTNISGFIGSEYAKEIKIIEDYVKSIEY